jgi:type III secretion system low calcium response chaperone LcrH/SycD
MANDEFSELNISKQIKEKLKNKTWLKKEFAKGKSAQEILGFSDEGMAKFYNAAYHLFEHRRYSDAANAFLFLATLNPQNEDYWLGLGMATQLMGDFENAIDAYEMAAICELGNPIPYFYLAKCLFAMHDRESALQALDLAIENSQDNSSFTEIYHQAQKAKNMLLRHK